MHASSAVLPPPMITKRSGAGGARRGSSPTGMQRTPSATAKLTIGPFVQKRGN